MGIEVEVKSPPKGPRLWIGPLGETIDIDLSNDSHAMYVALNPKIFGLPEDFAVEHLRKIDAGDNFEFDYDTVIVRAEMMGWARTSRDANKGAIAIGASTSEAARRALRVVIRNGYRPHRVEIEIEKIVDDAVEALFFGIEGRELNLFINKGRLSSGVQFLRPGCSPELIADIESTSFFRLNR